MEEKISKDEEYVLIQLGKTGIKYENYENFCKSAMRNIYVEAFKRTKMILKQNAQMQKDARLGRKSKKYRDVYNIIPFVGGRGTGKTSGMLSYMEAIKEARPNYRNGMEKDDNLLFKWEQDVPIFTCLDCIDCSLLEKDEDIFRVVLAQMYQKFRELDRDGIYKDRDYENHKRELLRQFNKVYRIMQKFTLDSMPRVDDSTTMENLQDFSSSLDLKETFENFVEQYLNLIRYEEFERPGYAREREENHYLVITLDDLDLNIDYGFNILEKIHRYLMVPRVIILMAFDMEQLERICYKHFYEEVPGNNGALAQHMIDEYDYAIKSLTRSYIDKVIPIESRIYMPELMKDKSYYRIQLQDIGHCDDGNIKALELKKALFHKFYLRTLIRWDIGGKKQHFYEATTFRQMVGQSMMLDYMDSLLTEEKEKVNDFSKKYRANYEIIYSDVSKRLISENLKIYNKKLVYFTDLIKIEPERYCREFFYYTIEKKLSDSLNEEAFRMRAKDFGYSYGELTRNIYYWGREAVDNNINKALIRCFMAVFTVEFSRLYQNYMESSDTNKKKYKETISRILNGSVAGSWAMDFLPEFVDESGGVNAAYAIGAAHTIQMEEFFEILIPDYNMSNGSFFGTPEKDKEIIQTLELLSLCFGSHSGREIEWEIGSEHSQWESVENMEILNDDDPLRSSKKLKVLKMKNKLGDVEYFNFMNFVDGSMQYESILERVKKAFIDFYKKEYPDCEKKFNSKIKDIYEKFSLLKAFQRWERAFGCFALPIYSFDLTYNLMKRTARKNRGITIRNTSDIYVEVQKTFKEIIGFLKENDDFYGEVSPYSLEMCFKKCPFVSNVMNGKNVLFRETYTKLIRNTNILQRHDDAHSYDDRP